MPRRPVRRSARGAGQARSRRPPPRTAAALVGYLPAGFPSMDGAIKAALAMAEAGADVIEVGLPYSDPLMDGPVIQEAVHRALTGGTRVTDVLRTVEAVAAAGVPALVMTYWNPVDHYGVDAFARDLAAAGGAGLITPDLHPGRGGALAGRLRRATAWTGCSWSRRSSTRRADRSRSPRAAAASSTRRR